MKIYPTTLIGDMMPSVDMKNYNINKFGSKVIETMGKCEHFFKIRNKTTNKLDLFVLSNSMICGKQDGKYQIRLFFSLGNQSDYEEYQELTVAQRQKIFNDHLIEIIEKLEEEYPGVASAPVLLRL